MRMRSNQPHIRAGGLNEFKALPPDQQEDAKGFLRLFAQAADDVRAGKEKDVVSAMKRRIDDTENVVSKQLERILGLD